MRRQILPNTVLGLGVKLSNGNNLKETVVSIRENQFICFFPLAEIRPFDSDIGIVGDLFTIIPEFEAAVRS